jgi:hypothetical protein
LAAGCIFNHGPHCVLNLRATGATPENEGFTPIYWFRRDDARRRWQVAQ